VHVKKTAKFKQNWDPFTKKNP